MEPTAETFEAAVIAAQDATGFTHPRPTDLLEALEWDGTRLCLGGPNAKQWDCFPEAEAAWHAAEAAFLQALHHPKA